MRRIQRTAISRLQPVSIKHLIGAIVMTHVRSFQQAFQFTILISLAGFLTADCRAQSVAVEEIPANGAELEARFISNAFPLVSNGRRSGEGYFSADGKWMVFQSERVVGNPYFQIFLMNMENGETTPVSPGEGKTTCAWIHPDGDRVMFASTHDDPEIKDKQSAEIEKRKTGKTGRYEWDYDPEFELYQWDRNNRQYVNLTNTLGYDAEGSYSPDGEWICFASNRQAYSRELSESEEKKLDLMPEYFMDLYIMRADGSELKQITDKAGYDGGPFFSPDGKRICWRSFNEAGTLAEIWTMNVDGSDKKQLTRLNHMSWAPYYHPSGEYLIFTTNVHGFKNFELYVVDTQGLSTPQRITYTEGFDGLPVFTPDGNKIVWTTSRNSDESEFFNSKKQSSQLADADWNHANALQALGLTGDKTSTVDVTDEEDQGQVAAGLTKPGFDKNDVMRHVMKLCDPDLKGRMTGTAGERKATAYVAAYMDALGIEPAGDKGTWFQQFSYPAGAEVGADSLLKAGDNELVIDQDWRPITFSRAGEFEPGEVVFAGYGIKAAKDGDNASYDSFVHLDVSDKWVMVFRYMPEDVEDSRRQFLAIHANLAKKAMELRDLGAKGMIVVSGPNSHFKDKLVPLKNEFSRGGTSLGAISISDDLAAEWLKKAGHDIKELQTKLDTGEQMMGFKIPDLAISGNVDIKQNRGKGRNVIGFLQVGDAPADQVVVIGAHIDHLGEGRTGGSLANSQDTTLIHFGADDNASGVAAMLEVAEYIADMKRKDETDGLRRDIIFAAWSGEELGLHGSNHYVDVLKKRLGNAMGSDDPNDPHAGLVFSVYPSVTAYLNMDMVGRYEDQLILQGLGSSEDWGGLIETANFRTRLNTKKVMDTNLPTDATGFYKAGVPILAAFTGSHSDYHTPRDTPDKIKYEETARVANFMGNVAVALCKRADPPKFQRYDKSSTGGMSGGVMGSVYLGTHPDYAFEGTGVRLTGTTAESPAEAAGLKEGDVIVELGTKKVENLNEYMFAIGALKIGKETTLKVMRGEEEVELKITPGVKE